MPIANTSRKGDLYVTFVIDMPDDAWLGGLDQTVRLGTSTRPAIP
jgi:DnaJ-class molecular chaperone